MRPHRRIVTAKPPAGIVRPNRYSGPCGRCGALVPASGGYAQNVAGKWAAYHEVGQCGDGPDDERLATEAAAATERKQAAREFIAAHIDPAELEAEHADAIADEYEERKLATRVTRLKAIDEAYGLSGMEDLTS